MIKLQDTTLLSKKSIKLIDKINKILDINSAGQLVVYENVVDSDWKSIEVHFISMNEEIVKEFIRIDFNSTSVHWRRLNKNLRSLLLIALCQHTFYKNTLIND